MSGRSRQFLFTILIILILWSLIEGISFLGYWAKYGKPFRPRMVASAMQLVQYRYKEPTAARGKSDLWWDTFVEVIHPYFGFVPDPARNPNISEYGFASGSNANPIQKRSNKQRILGLFGGSFAHGIYTFSTGTLQRGLSSLADSIMVLNFSTGGYKQPQSLIILAYLLSLGAQFDIVINVDGFNEVVLPLVDNLPYDVNPFYPRSWLFRCQNMIDPVQIRLIGHMEFLKNERKEFAEFFDLHKYHRSPLLALFWCSVDDAMAESIYNIRTTISQNENSPYTFFTHGPKYSYADNNEIFRDLISKWRNSSLQMYALCSSNGIAYFHFLQPNQYLDGSKPMKERERKLAINDNTPLGMIIRTAYPLLKQVGGVLKQKGVKFEDLSMIFQDNSNELYTDDCCHLNQQGYDIIARRICDVVIGK
jgi:hypothetical protein